ATAASWTSAVRDPTDSSRRRGPTVASAPAATTMQYDRLPRLTFTFMRFFGGSPGRRADQCTRLPGFQAGETAVVDTLTARVTRGEGNCSPSLPLRHRGRRRRLDEVHFQDGRRDEHDQLTTRGLRGSGLEQPAEHGDVPEERYLACLVDVQVRCHAADNESLPFLDEDLGLRLPLVDGGRT